MRHSAHLLTAGLCSLACLAGCGGSDDSFQAATGGGGTTASGDSGWIGAWGTAPYGPFPLGPLTEAAPVDPLAYTAVSLVENEQAVDQSFRMIVHPTIGGDTLRLRLSNLKGDRPVTFTSVQVALNIEGPANVPGTETVLLFDGQPGVTVAAGREAVSDAAEFSYAFGDNLAVSFHVVGESGPMTWHAVSFGLNYVGPPMAGDVTGDPTGISFAAQPTIGWFFISGIDVLAPDSPGTIVALGDSITDGAYQVPESDTRWPDFLAMRLDAAGIPMGVLNEGINSNSVTPQRPAWSGPPAIERFERDVLQRPGVRSVVIFEGTNDITAGADAETIYSAIRSLVQRAHAAGLCVVLGTIPPRDDLIFGWDRESMEDTRQALNAMIRGNTDIEGISDFDAVLGNPLEPTRPNLLYYSPDLLHPTSLGFQVMAETVPLEALVPPPAGNCTR